MHSQISRVVIFFFPYNPHPPHPDKPPRPSHPRGLDVGPFWLRLAPFRSILAPFGSVWLRFGSVSGPFRVRSGGVGWGRGGVGERGFCKGKEISLFKGCYLDQVCNVYVAPNLAQIITPTWPREQPLKMVNFCLCFSNELKYQFLSFFLTSTECCTKLCQQRR